MRKNNLIFLLKHLLLAAIIGLACAGTINQETMQAVHQWNIHDEHRPLPPVFEPRTAGTDGKSPGHPPSDAIVLFDGKDLSKWQMASGEPPKWKLEDGAMVVVKKTGIIETRQAFGDCQLHIGWASPVQVIGKGQGRGNSGVFMMGLYEIQVLDSYRNQTYADGQAAAVYGQYPPLVNVCRPPGEWQSYDIIFHRPHFDAEGKLLSPARFTVLHNGVLVQDNVELTGPTEYKKRPPYKVHPDKLPIQLQDHGNPVRYRNIWIRELLEKAKSK